MSPTLLFQHLRWRLLHNSLRLLLAQSLVRVLTIIAISVLIWGLIFGLTWAGLRELKVRGGVDLDLHVMELVLDLLFLTLSVMLTFSTGIILYSSLFASAESQFLMTAPIADDHIFAYKLQGGIAFSSWAFVLLGSPILIAYGIEIGDGAPWYYYAVMPLYFLGFILMPGSLGAVACLLLVNIVPRYRRQVLFGLAVLLAAGVLAWAIPRLREAPVGVLSRAWFEDVLSDLSLFGGRLVPFHWIARGLKQSALGRPIDMLYYLALVWSNGLFAYVATLWLARHLYRRGLNRAASGGTLRRRYGGGWMDAVCDRVLFFLDEQTRLLIVKDFRTFRRDPAQWAQILIFLGLALLYFPSMRRYYEGDLGRSFKNFISLLTLTATALLDVRLHEPLHLPDAEPGGAEVLDSRPAAARPCPARVGQVRVLGDGLSASGRVLRRLQQPDAWHAAFDGALARRRGRDARRGSERPERGAGRVHAELPRDRPVEDHDGLRRHAECHRGHLAALGAGRADGGAGASRLRARAGPAAPAQRAAMVGVDGDCGGIGHRRGGYRGAPARVFGRCARWSSEPVVFRQPAGTATRAPR